MIRNIITIESVLKLSLLNLNFKNIVVFKKRKLFCFRNRKWSWENGLGEKHTDEFIRSKYMEATLQNC